MTLGFPSEKKRAKPKFFTNDQGFVTCPNCGSESGTWAGACLSCTWSESEPLFQPHWMDEETWKEGLDTRWAPRTAGKRKK